MERIKALLRTAFDPNGNAGEKENARRAIERQDPRLKTLDEEDHQRFIDWHQRTDAILKCAQDEANRYFKLYEAAQDKLREFITIQQLLDK